MIPKECKRLAEVDFPIAIVSQHAAREKSIRYGHPSTLHLWWARRPLAACRAMLLALLLPDPCDENCPAEFKEKARALMPKVPGMGGMGRRDENLRAALLKFIGDFANWDLSSNQTYLEVSRGLIKAAHDETPLVVDPFAGGGSIPLEALRLGCDAFASDLNPVACLILKTMLEDIPRHGPGLADELRRVGGEIKKEAERELAEFYPADPDGAKPIAYLWARTVRCESPHCGAEIPLARSFWLSKKANRKRALRYKVVRPRGNTPRVDFEIFEPKSDRDVPGGTVSRAKAACPCCNIVLSPDRVRAQLREQRGGADVIFDKRGQRIGGARMLAVVTLRKGEQGRHYRLPTERDYQAVLKAKRRLEKVAATKLPNGLSPVPNEPTPAGGGSGAGRAFSVQKYGMMQWGDLFTARQKLALTSIATNVRQIENDINRKLASLLFSKFTELATANCPWEPIAECPRKFFNMQAIPVRWEYAEGVPISKASGSFKTVVDNFTATLEVVGSNWRIGQSLIASATDLPIPEESSSIWFTDPPYYDAVPYSDLSDFFFVWLKRSLPDGMMYDPFNPQNKLTPKVPEIVQDETRQVNSEPKNRNFFEREMARAFSVGRRALSGDGLACVVFAHKTTEGWEALLSGMIRGGWVITGSWPIATEQAHRPRARESAALATSVHLVCRPRTEDTIGDWGDVLRELPRRVGDWMERLQAEGVRGADLVFACIGPALEIFSQYSRVETAEGNEITLAQYLEKVWEVVGRSALEHVLGTAEARARNGAAGALEEDSRLTALFLWTMQSTSAGSANIENADGLNEADEDLDDDEEESSGKKSKGFNLPFDVVRRFAQPLGIRLPEWEGRIIEIQKGIVRLLTVGERAKQLFGQEGAQTIADRIESEPSLVQSGWLPGMEPAPQPPAIKGRKVRKATAKTGGEVSDEALEKHHLEHRGATTLDRVHAAMLLQAGGRAHALRALLKAEVERGPDFVRLANALTALYPTGSEEKRLLDAMLLAVPK